MSGRRRLALGVLAVWIATLGWHVKRTYFRPVTELVAEAATTLPPGTWYYTVLRDGRPVGWAQSRLDTLPSQGGFRVTDRLTADVTLPALGDGRIRLESEMELGPTLALRSFTVRSEGLLGTLRLEGEVLGDTVLVVRDGGPEGDVPPGTGREGPEGADGGEAVRRVRLDGPVVPAAALPLRFVAWREVRPGRRFRLDLFDPTTLSVRSVDVEVVAHEVRSFPDSATTDSTGRWIPASRDTVDAWLLSRTLAGVQVRSWVDEDGRLLEAEAGAGLRLRRTAFELAYYGREEAAETPGSGKP